MNSLALLLLVSLAVVATVADRAGNAPDNSCLLWGDPHIWSFDDTYYSFQDDGWHHVLVSSRLNIQSKFIKGCYTPILTNACARDLRIFILDDNDEVHSLEVLLSETQADGYVKTTQYSTFYQIKVDGEVIQAAVWNGQKVTYPGVQPNVRVPIGINGGGSAYFFMAASETIFTVMFKYEDVVVSHIPDVLTIVPTARKNSWLWKAGTCGLCASYNGVQGDDFTTHAVSPARLEVRGETIDDFAQTWAVGYAPKGIKNAPGAGEPVFTCNFEPNPTPVPTYKPTTPATGTPTRAPTPVPGTPGPTDKPTPVPTDKPTEAPTPGPTNKPTPAPTERPTPGATKPPTDQPTEGPTPTPSVTTGGSTTGSVNNTGNMTWVDINDNSAVDSQQGTQIYDDAVISCKLAGFEKGDALWYSCMFDVVQTNNTGIAVASAGAAVLAGCSKTNITDTSCTEGTLFACPSACNANGACVNGKCACNKGYEGETCTKAPLLTTAQLAAVISAGAVAGIAIGGAAFVGIAGFGAKKGYDYYHMKDNKMANVNSNPLYNEKKTGGVSPLYAEKA